jgi:hypothetical protein
VKTINWKNVKSADATGREYATRSNGLQALQYCARSPYAWPGGYDVFVITDDGGTICADCVRKEYAQMYHDTAFDGWHGTGWVVVAASASCNSDGPLNCDHCNRSIIDGEETD